MAVIGIRYPGAPAVGYAGAVYLLLHHRDLWVSENPQYGAAELPLLTPVEQSLYGGLKQQRWGVNVRLEQERIAWSYAWNVLVA